MTINRRENIGLLIPYIDKPVYVKGYCWGRAFNGWTVIYNNGENLMFDYRGNTYSVAGFLPSRYINRMDARYGNTITR